MEQRLPKRDMFEDKVPERMGKITRVFLDSDNNFSWMLFFIFILVNLLVFINAYLHSPFVGYDMGGHLTNVEYLSRLSWPNDNQSNEFFSPPLSYAIPALALAIGKDLGWAAKVGQMCNVLLSLGTTYLVLVICENILPNQTHLKTFALGFLGMLPVYYKTFSQMRGEPYLVFLALLTTQFAIRVFVHKELSFSNVIKLGLSLGTLVLARQWGFFVFPAVFLCGLSVAIADIKKRFMIIRALTLAAFISAIVGGWFYLYLYSRYGTFTAFNRTPDNSDKPLSFFIGTGDGKLFIDPVRPTFLRQAIPILYSEIWGDYFCDFSIYMIDTRINKYVTGRALERESTEKQISKWAITNRLTFNSYLGRTNLISFLPTILLLIGGCYGQFLAFQSLRDLGNQQKVIFGLMSNIVTITLLGYGWFLIRYPVGGPGDTLKPTYFLQIFPFLAIQTGALVQKIKTKQIWYGLGLLLVIIAVHNLPVMITHIIEFPWQTKLWSW